MKTQALARKVRQTWRKWMVLGVGAKRWLVVLALGAIVAGMGVGSLLVLMDTSRVLPSGAYQLLTMQFLPGGLRVFVPLLIGGAIVLLAIVRLGSYSVTPSVPSNEIVVESRANDARLSYGPRIVAIGGGTGLPTLLRGLTGYTDNITAIVTVADDGGSSGRLRRELGVLPPGDFRNNIAAMARDESLMAQLLQYRFGGRMDEKGSANGRSELQGHAFGNLLIAALTGITGSFDEALIATTRVLAVRGRVLPSTLSSVVLVGEVAVNNLAASRRVVGESAIPKAGGRIRRVSLEPSGVPAYPPAVQAILRADLVAIGPGSLYTSILPNLLVEDITTALQHTKAVRVFICNVATEPGETDNYSVADHVAAISRHIGRGHRNPSDWLDAVIANNNISAPTSAGGGNTLFVDLDGPADVPLVNADLADSERPWRHDSKKLAAEVIRLLGKT